MPSRLGVSGASILESVYLEGKCHEARTSSPPFVFWREVKRGGGSLVADRYAGSPGSCRQISLCRQHAAGNFRSRLLGHPSCAPKLCCATVLAGKPGQANPPKLTVMFLPGNNRTTKEPLAPFLVIAADQQAFKA
jgi:hypothetical protein